MRNKSLFIVMLFILFANVAMAQNDKHKMTDTQKAQAAKADVYIINSKKKIADSLTTRKDSTTSKKNKSAKRNKKSS
jgi:hypothetical protein